MVVAVLPEGVTDEGLNVQLMPDGPVQLKVTAPVNPLTGATLSMRVVDPPTETVALWVDAENVKSGVVPPPPVLTSIVPKSPCVSPARPAVKYKVSGLPVPPAPNTRAH